jgi:hypothetical protein
MVEYWNGDLNKEAIHLLTSLSKGILSIDHFFQELFTHYSITPVFEFSAWNAVLHGETRPKRYGQAITRDKRPKNERQESVPLH